MRTFQTSAALTLILTGLLGGCSPETDQQAARQQPQAAATQLLIRAPELAERLDDPAVTVLHVGGSERDFREMHIPGARHLPMPAIVQEIDGMLNELPPIESLDSVFEALGIGDEGVIIVYGDPLPAARAFFTLDFLGHGDRVALLEGGIHAWQDAGLPLSNEPADYAAAAFTPRPQPHIPVDKAWIQEHLDAEDVVLVDARPLDQFTGEVPGTDIPRGGHIPGAVSLYWELMLTPDEPWAVLETDTLRALFTEAGISPSDTVVTYCRTGMQASFSYFIARLLGHEARMYDPSFAEWSNDPDLPVTRGE